MNAPEKTSLEIIGLSVTYAGHGTHRRSVRAVRDCSFSVSRGETVGLVGESGSGKSSVLMSIPRLLPESASVTGKIFCRGVEISSLSEAEMNRWRWRKIAIVPQGAMNSFTPHLTIGRHITEVLEHHFKMPRHESEARAAELVKTAGLNENAVSRYPHEMSGGEKQRAALAAAIACEPDFLLADEPTTALDVITQKEVLETITSLTRDRGMGVLLVTHDLPLASGSCDSLLVMRDGEIVERGPAREVTSRPKEPYTRMLTDAVRDMEKPR
ncbi:MAG: ABC transporter ATP-binding protein [Synergistaceae bacterium]|jgi:ABC-type glutathione transport system ATPase component|nr:ABC transporter ATP-binding protein [Synergistaceae bacterium]